jgi:bilirubin oxidase
MDRRRFLHYAAALAGFPFLARAAGMDHHMGHGAPAPASAGTPPVLTKGRPLPALPRLANRSRKAGRFEATLVAAPGKANFAADRRATPVWAYNGKVPGPLIEVYEGDWVEIAFTNHLPQPTTIHWHGLPVPANQDGNPHDAVAPGATRHYRFRLPEGSAGTYWYHPHPHGHTSEQVFRGLAGAFIVRSRKDPLAGFAERNLLLSDLRLAGNGEIAPNGPADWHDGREGDHVLVNGALEPSIVLGKGETQRWRVWNATSARILQLALPGHEVKLVGTDGGLIEAPRSIERLILAPGERAELLVTGRFSDKAAGLVALPYTRGKMMHPEDSTPRVLASVVESIGATAQPAIPSRLRSIKALPAAAVKRKLEFSENMADPKAMFLINGRTFNMRRVDFVSKLGQVEEWDIISNAHMDHPFHVHGTQFQVVARNEDGKWRAELFLAWRDTVNVPANQAVRIRLRQELPGLRMFHCHILEHEEQGMMGQFEVRK